MKTTKKGKRKPSREKLALLSSFLESHLDIKEGTLVQSKYNFVIIETIDGPTEEDTKRLVYHRYDKNTILMFLELTYDLESECIAARVMNNKQVSMIPFATYEELEQIDLIKEDEFVDFFSGILTKWEPGNKT